MRVPVKTLLAVLLMLAVLFVLRSILSSSHWIRPKGQQDLAFSEDEVLMGRGATWKLNSGSSRNLCYPGLFDPVSVCGEDRGDAKDRTGQHPVQHLYFLKTHKTGSQTLGTLFNRYALVHNLTVVMRRDLKHLTPTKESNWIRYYRPHPQGPGHYDFFTDHVRFNETCVRYFLPNDTIFISSVREPLDNFVSAFYFIRGFRKSIPGPDPILTFLSNMSRWDTKLGHMTHSIMSWDHGLDFNSLHRPGYLQKYLKYLSRVFHLTIVTEKIDEGLVLLKRMLSWRLTDVLYVKLNTGKKRKNHNFTAEQVKEFMDHRQEEYALYHHFQNILQQKLGAQDATFPAEVAVFKTMRNRLEAFCRNVSATEDLRVEETQFSDRFRVSRQDCQLLTTPLTSPTTTWFLQLMLRRMERSG